MDRITVHRVQALGLALLLGSAASSAFAGPTVVLVVHGEHSHTIDGTAYDRSDSAAYAETLFPDLVTFASSATTRGVKLTIMLNSNWPAVIAADGIRKSRVAGWINQGHEIGYHHHSTAHGDWDGYTDCSTARTVFHGIACGSRDGDIGDYLAKYAAVSWLPSGYTLVGGAMTDQTFDRAETPDGKNEWTQTLPFLRWRQASESDPSSPGLKYAGCSFIFNTPYLKGHTDTRSSTGQTTTFDKFFVRVGNPGDVATRSDVMKCALKAGADDVIALATHVVWYHEDPAGHEELMAKLQNHPKNFEFKTIRALLEP